MNARLRYEVEFLGGAYINGMLELNRYTVGLDMETKTLNADDITIALERVRTFVYGILDHTVFVNQHEPGVADLLATLGVNVTTLPEDPHDQIIGMALYHKLNSIMEGRVQVFGIDIKSEMGNDLMYCMDQEDQYSMFDADGWWQHASTRHNCIEPEHDPNVLRVQGNGWKELDLDWTAVHQQKSSGHVVYGQFRKDDTR